MATVLVLRHPENPKKLPPVRLTLTGATLVTCVEGSGMESIQNLASPEAAKALLDRTLRLRRDEGYLIVERGEIPDGVEPIDDPITAIVDFDEARRRTQICFEQEAPLAPAGLAEVVRRLEAAAPACLEHSRRDDHPAGLFLGALAGRMLPSVRAFVYSTVTPPWNPTPPLDDLADLFALLPNLERVDAAGAFTLGQLRHDALAELHLDPQPTYPDALAALRRGSLPSLTTFGIVLDDQHDIDRALAAALHALHAPRLHTITVEGLRDLTGFLAELTERSLPTSWARIHVNGDVADEDELLAVLRERAPVLRTVGELGLPLVDEVSEGGVAEAHALHAGLLDVSGREALWAVEASEDW